MRSLVLRMEKREGTGAYDVIDVNAPATNKQFTSDNEYTGTADGMDKQMSYEDIYNATFNEIKEDISRVVSLQQQVQKNLLILSQLIWRCAKENEKRLEIVIQLQSI